MLRLLQNLNLKNLPADLVVFGRLCIYCQFIAGWHQFPQPKQIHMLSHLKMSTWLITTLLWRVCVYIVSFSVIQYKEQSLGWYWSCCNTKTKTARPKLNILVTIGFHSLLRQAFNKQYSYPFLNIWCVLWITETSSLQWTRAPCALQNNFTKCTRRFHIHYRLIQLDMPCLFLSQEPHRFQIYLEEGGTELFEKVVSATNCWIYCWHCG